MLGKLIKHEFKATGRVMLPVLGVLLVLAVLANISFNFIDTVQTEIGEGIFSLIIIAFILFIMASGIIALVMMIQRFQKNLLGDEGYLMLTLPVTEHGLVWSKIIVSCVWFVVYGLIVFLALFLTVVNFANMNLPEMFSQLPSLHELMTMLEVQQGISSGDLVVFGLELLAMIAICSVCACLLFYASLSLGHCFTNNKMLLSVVFFIGICFVLQIISIPMTMLIPDSLLVASTGQEVLRAMKYLMLYYMGCSAIQGALLYFTTTISLKKGLNMS